jgi:dTDP-4-amino-4,6-dideoxygalactose transaminase
MRQRYHHEILGFNFRLTDISAAIGLVQFAKLERNTRRRREIAARYDDGFSDVPSAALRVPVTPEGRTHVFHQYTIDVGPDRDAIVSELAEQGVGTGVYYPIPVHRQPYVMERGLHADLPVTDRAAERTLSLPMYPGLSEDEQMTVINAVRRSVEVRTPVGAAAAGAPAETVTR